MAVAQIRITGDVRQALAAMDSLGIRAEEVGKSTEHAFGRMAANTGNVFQRLSQTLGNFGVPFSESVGKMGDKFAETETKGQKTFQALSSVGGAALLGLSAGAVAVGVESVKMAATFQQSTANLAAKAAIPTEAAAGIGKAFLTTAGQTTFSAQQMVQAYGNVAGQLGAVQGRALNSQQALGVMRAATDLAEGSATSLDTATASLAQTMQAFHLGASSAADASNVLFNTSRLTGNGVDAVAAAAAKLKMRLGDATPSLDHIGGLMVELADHGVTGSRSVTMVGSTLAGLVFPTTTAKKTLGEMGVTLTDAHGKFIGLPPALDALRAGFMKLPGATNAAAAAQQLVADKTTLAKLALEKQTPAVKAHEDAIKKHDLALSAQASALDDTTAAQAIFGKNAATLMPIVLAGSAALDQQTVAVRKTGSAHDAAEKQAATLHGSMEKLKATGEDLGVSLGAALIPKLETLAKDTAQVVNWFEKHKAVAEALAGVVGGALALAIGAFTVNKLASFARGIADAGKSVGGLIQKISGFGGSGGLDGAGDKAASSLDGAASKLQKAADSIASSAQKLAAAGESAGADIKGGAAAAETDLEAGGAASGGELKAGGATAETELSAGGATAGAEETAGGVAAGAAMSAAMVLVGAAVAKQFADKLPGAKDIPQADAGVVAVTSKIPILGPLGNDIGASILHGIGAGGDQMQLSKQQIAAYTVTGLNGQPLQDRAPQPRAAGGPIAAGRTYFVGEHGPELFVSSTAGTIIPNVNRTVASMAGGSTVTGTPDMTGMGAPVYHIDQLVVVAQNPADMERQLQQRARLASIAGGNPRPGGG